MNIESDAALARRFQELNSRAESQYYPVCSDFLNLHEQSVLQSTLPKGSYFLWGGVESAERKIACFGAEDLDAAKAVLPMTLLCVRPAMQKFADALTHRDFLGSILGLGVRREMIGDIFLADNCGYVFCLDTIATYLTENLERVRHTSVRIEVLTDCPALLSAEPPQTSFVVASDRLDALLAAVFSVPRKDAQAWIAGGLVFIDSCVQLHADYHPAEGAIVSVRHHGRFRYNGPERTTKKGKLRILAQVY